MMVAATERAPQTSDGAVQARTGRTWSEWFAILDGAGAQAWDHKAIVAYLHQHFPDLGGWWEQSVTVSYEQVRGGRDKHQRTDGYSVSVSKTCAAPLSALYGAWHDPAARARWLPDPQDAPQDAGFTIRRATPEKTMRITWVDGTSSVEVRFTGKGADKSQVTVQHGKLADAGAAARAKAYWTGALERLKRALES